VATANAAPSASPRATTFLASRSARVSDLAGTVTPHVARLATLEAVAGGSRSSTLRKALLAVFYHAVEVAADHHIVEACLMNRAPLPQGWRCGLRWHPRGCRS
jgi:hypothetical protein